MANPAPVGSDVSAGTYRCVNCGYEMDLESVQSLPPCPECQRTNVHVATRVDRYFYLRCRDCFHTWSIAKRGAVEQT